MIIRERNLTCYQWRWNRRRSCTCLTFFERKIFFVLLFTNPTVFNAFWLWCIQNVQQSTLHRLLLLILLFKWTRLWLTKQNTTTQVCVWCANSKGIDIAYRNVGRMQHIQNGEMVDCRYRASVCKRWRWWWWCRLMANEKRNFQPRNVREGKIP